MIQPDTYRNSRTRSPWFLLLLLVFSVHSSSTLTAQSRTATLNTACNNYIRIAGKTNITSFSLEQEVPGDMTGKHGDSGWFPIPGEHLYLITIPVRNFSTGNRIVYKDFLELVNVKKHPYIQISMDEGDFINLFNRKFRYQPKIGVTVSGTTQYYRVTCTISECVDGRITISGNKRVKLTDFKLAPPEKSLGLIKVQNELIINFEFSLPEEQNLKLTAL